MELLCLVWGALALAIVSPGPSFIITARTGVAKGRRHGFALALGIAVGTLVIFSAFRLGFAVLFRVHPQIYLVMQLLGGGYLIFLALKMLLGRAHTLDFEDDDAAAGRRRESCLTGLMTQLSNPKAWVVYMSIYAAFAVQNLSNLRFGIFLAGAVFLEISWYSTVAGLLASSRPRRAFLRHERLINACCGCLLLLLGLEITPAGTMVGRLLQRL